jgi:UDP-N-acetylmuramate: L-alanyl-gamma-D-glutamyl-meso-diaminopimelate ligase
VRTVPRHGQVLALAGDAAVDALLDMGCWSRLERFGESGDGWRVRLERADGRALTITPPDGGSVTLSWNLLGRHNALNALAATAAAHAVGVEPGTAATALASFRSPRRRLELRSRVRDIAIYDDFAHHPTAIAVTLEALRAAVGTARIVAVLDPASNTMRMGVHRDTLAPALRCADRVLLHHPSRLGFDLAAVAAATDAPATVHDCVDDLVATLCLEARPGDHVLIMSNGAFGGIHDRLAAALEAA